MITFNLALGALFSIDKRKFYVSGREYLKDGLTIEITEVGKKNKYLYKEEEIKQQDLIYEGINK